MIEQSDMMSVFKNVVWLATCGSMFFLASPVSAQDEGASPQSICNVSRLPSPSNIVAGCAGRGFLLGPADSFQVYENTELQAVLIDLLWGSERRVLMISFPEGSPFLEDITGNLGHAAGRGPLSGLRNVSIDFSQFEKSGAVHAQDARHGVSQSSAGRVELAQSLSSERARVANSPSDM